MIQSPHQSSVQVGSEELLAALPPGSFPGQTLPTLQLSPERLRTRHFQPALSLLAPVRKTQAEKPVHLVL